MSAHPLEGAVGFVYRARDDGTLNGFKIEPGTDPDEVFEAMRLIGCEAESITALAGSTGVAKAADMPMKPATFLGSFNGGTGI